MGLNLIYDQNLVGFTLSAMTNTNENMKAFRITHCSSRTIKHNPNTDAM